MFTEVIQISIAENIAVYLVLYIKNAWMAGIFYLGQIFLYVELY